jgi:hypothetical protein
MFSADEKEAEIKLGVLTDAPTPLALTYELWIKRRERPGSLRSKVLSSSKRIGSSARVRRETCR